MMRTINVFPILGAGCLLAAAMPASAQWSIKAGDPRPSDVPYLVEEIPPAAWDASNFADPPQVERFKDWRYGLMVSIGISADGRHDLSWGEITPNERKMPDGNALADGASLPMGEWSRRGSKMALEKFDAREWVRWAQESGFKYIVVIAKHHEGFHLWDTAHSDFKITNAAFGSDFIKEIADASHEAGLPFGIYYSQRDWHHPDYQPTGFGPDGKQPGPHHQKYIDYQFSVVRELLTKYGKIDIFWWDALWWGGMYKAADWDAERLTRMVRELQPGIIQNNRASVPGDFDTPEQRMGIFQNKRAWEAVVSLEDTWSYTGKNPKSPSQLIDLLVKSAVNDGNLLLSLGPQWAGNFDPVEMQATREVGTWLKTFGPSIYGTRGGPWKNLGWGGSTWRGSTAYLHMLELHGGEVALPAIAGRTVRKAAVLLKGPDGELQRKAVVVSQMGGVIRVSVPMVLQNEIDTIVELQFSRSLAGVEAVPIPPELSGASAAGPFGHELVYGRRATDAAAISSSGLQWDVGKDSIVRLLSSDGIVGSGLPTKEGPGQWIQLDLGAITFVTGIMLDAMAAQQPLAVSLSKDGGSYTTVWQSAGKAAKGPWPIEVNDFAAGAQTPGREARYVRVFVESDKPAVLAIRQMGVWTKAAK